MAPQIRRCSCFVNMQTNYNPPPHCLKIINQCNQGVSKARNVGLEHAVGEYVMFVDADDYLTADTLHLFLQQAQQANCDLGIAGMRRVSRGGNATETKLQNKAYDTANLYSLRTDLDDLVLGSPCLKLFKRSIIAANKIKFDESLPLFEDAVFVYLFLKHCSKVITTEIVLYNYMVNGSSATAKFRGNDFVKCFALYREAQYQFIKSQSISPAIYQNLANLIDRNSAFQVLFALYTIYRAPNRPRKGQYAILKQYVGVFKEVLDNVDGVRGVPLLVFKTLKIHPFLTHCLMKTIFLLNNIQRNKNT